MGEKLATLLDVDGTLLNGPFSTRVLWREIRRHPPKTYLNQAEYAAFPTSGKETKPVPDKRIATLFLLARHSGRLLKDGAVEGLNLFREWSKVIAVASGRQEVLFDLTTRQLAKVGHHINDYFLNPGGSGAQWKAHVADYYLRQGYDEVNHVDDDPFAAFTVASVDPKRISVFLIETLVSRPQLLRRSMPQKPPNITICRSVLDAARIYTGRHH